MLALISRFLPGLGGVLPALLNPWVLLGLMATVSFSFLYGLHIGNERLDSVVEAQQKIDAARKAVVRYVRVEQKVIDKETVNALKGRNDQLARDNAALRGRLQNNIASSINPGVSRTPPGTTAGSTVCFDRTKFVAGLRGSLQGFIDQHRQSLERGDRAIIALRGCSEFVEKQHALTSVGKE